MAKIGKRALASPAETFTSKKARYDPSGLAILAANCVCFRGGTRENFFNKTKGIESYITPFFAGRRMYDLFVLFFFLLLIIAHALSHNCFSATRHEVLYRERLHGPPNDYHHGGKFAGEWFQNNAEPSIRCLTDERVGPWGDGGKWICQPSCLLSKNNYNYANLLHETAIFIVINTTSTLATSE